MTLHKSAVGTYTCEHAVRGVCEHCYNSAEREARAAALEEAAKVAEGYDSSDPRDHWTSTASAKAIAARIRSLKETP